MKYQHLWLSITFLALSAALFPASLTIAAEAKLERPDEEEAEEAEVLLRPRNLYRRAPASLENASQGYWRYSPNAESDFAVGIFLTEDLSLRSSAAQASSNLSSTGVTTEEESNVALPVASVRAGYRFSESVSAYGNFAVDFKTGTRDPILGVALLLPVTDEFTTIGTLSLAIPVSPASRETSKLTAITAAINPLYQEGPWFVGGSIFFSYHLYQSAKTDVTSDNSGFSGSTNAVQDIGLASSTLPLTTVKETTTTGGSLYVGREVSRYVSANIGLATSSSYLEDGNFSWATEATLVRITANHAGFAGSLAFSFLSDPVTDSASFTLPSQPFLGFRLQYVFGTQSVMGIPRTESQPYVR